MPANYAKHRKKLLKDPAVRQAYVEERERLHLAIQIADLRRRRGLTQAELARRIGTTPLAIARIESTEYENYSLDLLRRVAKATDSALVVRFESRPRRRAQA